MLHASPYKDVCPCFVLLMITPNYLSIKECPIIDGYNDDVYMLVMILV